MSWAQVIIKPDFIGAVDLACFCKRVECMLSKINIGIVLGLLFCFISAAFDVYVAFATQTLNTIVVIFYCFISSALLFLGCSLCQDRRSLFDKLRRESRLVVLVNVSVVFNWGGFFMRCVTWNLPWWGLLQSRVALH